MNSRKAELRLAAQFEDAIARGACLAPAMQRDYQLLKRRMNQKKVVEPRPGVFAPVDCWNKLGDRQRYLHVLRSMAAKHPDWVFCSFSAAVIQGLAVSKKQLRAIHIASPANHCGEAPTGVVRYRPSQLSVVTINGLKTTPEVETVFCCAARGGFSEGLIVADSFLRNNNMDSRQLYTQFLCIGKNRPGKACALRVARYADGRSENGGESKARAVMIEGGWETPDLQVEIDDPEHPGNPYRVDFLWPHLTKPVIGELDGLEKYRAAKTEDDEQHALNVMMRERQRESRLSLAGFTVMRFTMEDVNVPERLYRKMELAGIPRIPLSDSLRLGAPVTVSERGK